MTTVVSPLLRWGRTLLASVLALGGASAGVLLIVTIYGAVLGWQVRGAPGAQQIHGFAEQIAPWATPALVLILTAILAAWVSRSSHTAGGNGLAIGVLVALGALLLGMLPSGVWTLALLAAIVLAGWLGDTATTPNRG
ncbi:MAG TPA: hypothetical protein VGW38_14085 [Chloroflexota bacterium]|nr:hypothetical protein [Chloroflexota bacterium]